MDFESAAKKFAQLPKTWHPRRDQPSWDRDFNGRASINSHVAGRTDKMKQHIMEAATFSEIIMNGMTESDRMGMAKTARTEIASNARKNGK